MDTLEDAVRRLIKEKYGSIPKFAKVIEEAPTSIYGALDRGLGNTRTELTDKIYRELNIDWETAKLSGFRGLRLKNSKPEYVEIALYGSIAAGRPLEMIEVTDTFPVPRVLHERYPDAFLLRVVGESMNRILTNGCYALVDPCEEIERDYQPYAVCVNSHAATIKRVRKLSNGFELVPDSDDPTFRPVIYDFGVEGTETVTVIGRVVWDTKPFDWSY